MPCQCGSAEGTDINHADDAHAGCECAAESASGCACGSGAPTVDRETSLERVVMELDKRLRKLEAGR